MRVPRAAGALSFVVVWLCACDQRAPAEHVDEDLALQVGEARISRAELEALLPYFDTVDRRIGRNSRIRHLIDNHLLPMAAARIAFAEQRAERRRQAEALAAVVGNGGYPALRTQGRLSGQDHEDSRRQDFPLPVAAWLFDAANLGMVSPVIETPQGFSLASAYDLRPGETPLQDRVEAFQATFYTHRAPEFATWWSDQRQRLVGQVRYVHPDYRDAVPPWLTP